MASSQKTVKSSASSTSALKSNASQKIVASSVSSRSKSKDPQMASSCSTSSTSASKSRVAQKKVASSISSTSVCKPKAHTSATDLDAGLELDSDSSSSNAPGTALKSHSSTSADKSRKTLAQIRVEKSKLKAGKDLGVSNARLESHDWCNQIPRFTTNMSKNKLQQNHWLDVVDDPFRSYEYYDELQNEMKSKKPPTKAQSSFSIYMNMLIYNANQIPDEELHSWDLIERKNLECDKGSVGIIIDTKRVYYEKQNMHFCGRHALNNLIGGSVFNDFQLFRIAHELDEVSKVWMSETKSNKVRHCDKNGNYNPDVLVKAFQVATGITLRNLANYTENGQVEVNICHFDAFLILDHYNARERNGHYFAMKAYECFYALLDSVEGQPIMLSYSSALLYVNNISKMTDRYQIWVVPNRSSPDFDENTPVLDEIFYPVFWQYPWNIARLSNYDSDPQMPISDYFTPGYTLERDQFINFVRNTSGTERNPEAFCLARCDGSSSSESTTEVSERTIPVLARTIGKSCEPKDKVVEV